MEFDLKEWAKKELPLAAKRAEALRSEGRVYAEALETMRILSSIVAEEEYREERKHFPEAIAIEQPHLVEDPAPQEDAAPDPEPEPEPTEPERPIPKLEDVRGKCGEAKKAGVDIKSILNELGYKNLSSVDSKDYNTLLDKVAVALEAIG